jgi:hypothetical protein
MVYRTKDLQHLRAFFNVFCKQHAFRLLLGKRLHRSTESRGIETHLNNPII